MGTHKFTLNLNTEITSPELTHSESGSSLVVDPSVLYTVVSNLRNDLLADLEDLNAEDFKSAVEQANQVNAIMSKLEGLGASAHFETDEDDEDDEDPDLQ
jgi:hypothetical protein